jgi:hypothetical protein
MNFKELVESVLLLEVTLSKANRIRFMKQFNTDSTKANEYINQFNNVVLKLSNTDIFSYKSLEELDKALKEARGIKTKGEAKRESALTGSKIVFENEDYVLRLIRSKSAAIIYGKGANWCISYDDRYRGEEDEITGNLFWHYALEKYNSIYIAEAKKLPADIAQSNGAIMDSVDIKVANRELKKIALLINEKGHCEIWSTVNDKLFDGDQARPVPEVEHVYKNVQRIVKFVPYSKEEIEKYSVEGLIVGVYYARSTGVRVPWIEEKLLNECVDTANFSNNIIFYGSEVVRDKWPEYEEKLLKRLRYLKDHISYYTPLTIQRFGYLEPFFIYLQTLQNVNKAWPELPKALKGVANDHREFSKLYVKYQNIIWEPEDIDKSRFYYEDRGI